MNERDFALRVIARLNNPTMHTPGRRPYTLPEPTIEDIVMWLEYERFPNKQLVHARYAAMPENEYTRLDSYKREVAWCKRLAVLTEELYQEGAITPEQYERITTPRELSGKERAALLEQIRRWRPTHDSTTTKHGERMAVYGATSPAGEYIYLTYEDGQWWHHDDYPYPHWSHEH